MADKNILPVPAVHLQPGNLPTRDFLQQIRISNSRAQWAGSGGQAVIDQESDEARSRRPY